MVDKLIIGSRGSKLALEQSKIVLKKLTNSNKNISCEIIKFKTKGDELLNQSVQNLIDKGFFVNEIQKRLINCEIDLSVHSLKDLPTTSDPKIILSSILKRGSHLDVLVSKNNETIHDLKDGSVIATSSIRRKYQLLKMNPNFIIKEIRGNVDSRIKKLDNGYCDALVLAEAGLNRLNLNNRISYYFNLNEILPAAGQGAIAIEARKNDKKVIKILDEINHYESFISTKIERDLLVKFQLGCNAPLAAFAQIKKNKIYLKAMLFSLKKMEDITISVVDDIKNYDLIVDRIYSEFKIKNYTNILDE